MARLLRTLGDRHPMDLGLTSGVTAFNCSLYSTDGAIYKCGRHLAPQKGWKIWGDGSLTEMFGCEV